MKHIVVEYLGSRPLAVHHVYLPDVGDKFFAQQVRSLEAFRKSVRAYRAAYERQKDVGDPELRQFTVFNYPQDFEEWEAATKRVYEGRSDNPLGSMKVHAHKDVWEFYRFIEYSYVKRRLRSWPNLRRGRPPKYLRG